MGADSDSADAGRVLDFWFGTPGSPQYGRARAEWFRKDPAFDQSVIERFGMLIERALRGELAAWAAEPPSALAQIILLDQLTRNAFRDTARAFAGDRRALGAAVTMVGARQDITLIPVRRAFVYMPFEHAEGLATQDEAVRLFTRLVTFEPGLQDMLDYALMHREVIRRYGRFPHRNAALGRQSTSEELAYLSRPGSGF